MTVAQSAKPSSSNITVTLKRLIALLEEDETDEYGILQPKPSAFKLTIRLVVDAYKAMGERFPRASASTDELGGIRLTWSKQSPEREVRLVCPATAEQQAYLYHEMGDNYAVERDVTASILVQWLELLNQACPSLSHCQTMQLFIEQRSPSTKQRYHFNEAPAFSVADVAHLLDERIPRQLK